MEDITADMGFDNVEDAIDALTYEGFFEEMMDRMYSDHLSSQERQKAFRAILDTAHLAGYLRSSKTYKADLDELEMLNATVSLSSQSF